VRGQSFVARTSSESFPFLHACLNKYEWCIFLSTLYDIYDSQSDHVLLYSTLIHSSRDSHLQALRPHHFTTQASQPSTSPG
jgi:hypothetical protein